LKTPRQIIYIAQIVANVFANFAEAPLLVDVAEAEAKCDQRNRGYPEGPIGPNIGRTREVKTGTYPLNAVRAEVLVRIALIIKGFWLLLKFTIDRNRSSHPVHHRRSRSEWLHSLNPVMSACPAGRGASHFSTFDAT
jgi:hypothetical protein